jgi:hypothetical protein
MKRNSVLWFLRQSLAAAVAGALLAACGVAGPDSPAYETSGEGVAADGVLPAARVPRQKRVPEGAPDSPDAPRPGDPCEGVSRQGECDGAAAVRCTGEGEGERRLVRIDCGLLGLACGVGAGHSVACTGRKRARRTGD